MERRITSPANPKSQSMIDQVQTTFRKKFSQDPLLIRAPGRVNLIGEHTDYNEGFVLPAAIDKAMYFAIAPNGLSTCRLHALDMGEDFEFDLNEFKPLEGGWPNYLMGVVDELILEGKTLEGFDCVFGGDIPVGAGLSSSAALECGLAFGLNHLYQLGLGRQRLAFIAQHAEHTYAGVKCGIMDQFASLFGKHNQVVKLDCRTMEYDYVPLDLSDHLIVLCDTGVSHSLAASEYNLRRQQCEAGVAAVQQGVSDVASLRDVSLEMLQAARQEMDPMVFQRCSYVIEENERLHQACKCLEAGDLHGFGQNMYGSHEGLSKKYEVSCPELDVLVELAKQQQGVLGARMMGGGFGGCTINLVAQDALEAFEVHMSRGYQQQTGRDLKVYVTRIEQGVALVEA